MSNNRKGAEAVILDYIQRMIPGDKSNVEIYKRLFARMDDDQFEQFMKDLAAKRKNLAIIAPNLAENELNVQRNVELAKELNYNFFQRVWIQGTGDTPTYLSPVPYMVVKLPLRRQAQLLVKKISIPEHNKSVDDFTGQPTGASKGAKISYPEIQVFAAMGLDQTLNEFLKFRGGDIKGFDAMNKSINRTGGVSLKAIEPYASGVESTRTMKTFFTSMHLASTL